MFSASPLNTNHRIFLADAKDDRLLFKNALQELPVSTRLSIVYNGEQLMQPLNKSEQLPHLLFFYLNLPQKNRFAHLVERIQGPKLKRIPAIIFSISFDHNAVNLLYKSKPQSYFRKPNGFSQLKSLINQPIELAIQTQFCSTSGRQICSF